MTDADMPAPAGLRWRVGCLAALCLLRPDYRRPRAAGRADDPRSRPQPFRDRRRARRLADRPYRRGGALRRALDRIGPRKALFPWSLDHAASGFLRGLTGDFVTLSLAVGLFGIGGTIVSSGAPKVVSQWFRARDRGFAMGIYITGPAIGRSSRSRPQTRSWHGERSFLLRCRDRRRRRPDRARPAL
jgi:hypothetical protein